MHAINSAITVGLLRRQYLAGGFPYCHAAENHGRDARGAKLSVRSGDVRKSRQ
jgi:hypothetical protein